MASANTNPGLRYLKNSRLTPEEKIEVYRHIRDNDPDVQALIHAGVEPATPLITIAETIDAARELMQTGNEIKGLRTGYKNLDEMTGGLNPSEILVLFADTGQKKSLFVQNITLNIVKRGEPVLFIGLEMTNTENTLRIMQMNSPENSNVSHLPVLYPQSNDIGYKDIDALVGAAKKEGAKLVIIDHLHMFEVENGNRADGIEDICQEFKRVTRKHEMPMLLVAHIAKRMGKVGPPELDELKGSAAIKQLADIAITLWSDPREDPQKAELHVICRKQRKGWRKRKFTLSPMPNGRLAEGIEISAFPNN
jgi:replicative DNA helicase